MNLAVLSQVIKDKLPSLAKEDLSIPNTSTFAQLHGSFLDTSEMMSVHLESMQPENQKSRQYTLTLTNEDGKAAALHFRETDADVQNTEYTELDPQIIQSIFETLKYISEEQPAMTVPEVSDETRQMQEEMRRLEKETYDVNSSVDTEVFQTTNPQLMQILIKSLVTLPVEPTLTSTGVEELRIHSAHTTAQLELALVDISSRAVLEQPDPQAVSGQTAGVRR